MQSSKQHANPGKLAWRWHVIATWLVGFGALLWFLIRVIPKPSRAAYPCQRAAFPVASVFVINLTAMMSTCLALPRVRRHVPTVDLRKPMTAALVIAGLAGGFVLADALVTTMVGAITKADPYVPADLPNTPIGVGVGIHPGRVAWAHNPDATHWDSAWDYDIDRFYWDDDHTDQAVVDQMVNDCLLSLTGEATAEEAWDALFRSFNERLGRGATGYQAGETLYIKVNHVEQRSHDTRNNRADLTPQVEVALLDQIVDRAGVPEDRIWIGDASRFITAKVFDRMHTRHPDVHYMETNYYMLSRSPGTDGRTMTVPSSQSMIDYSGRNSNGLGIPGDRLPMEMVNADYIINLGVMKGHATAGVTLCAKNWYGCFCTTPGNAQHDLLPSDAPDPGQYRPITDLMAHEHLGRKTMLFILDGLYGFERHGVGTATPVRWDDPPFNDDYPSSILMSQDMVAIDSVGLDFLRAQFGDDMGGSGSVGNGAIDDYMHEAALIGSAPSGTVYDPEGDGTPMTGSLGVHEHWNNAVEKKYSRNLGTGEGIELVKGPPDGPGGDGDTWAWF